MANDSYFLFDDDNFVVDDDDDDDIDEMTKKRNWKHTIPYVQMIQLGENRINLRHRPDRMRMDSNLRVSMFCSNWSIMIMSFLCWCR